MHLQSRTNVASVGSAFKSTRKGKVLSSPETIKEKSTFRAIFPLLFQEVRQPLPFALKNYFRAVYFSLSTLLHFANQNNVCIARSSQFKHSNRTSCAQVQCHKFIYVTTHQISLGIFITKQFRTTRCVYVLKQDKQTTKRRFILTTSESLRN